MGESSPLERDLKGTLHTPEGISPRIGYQSLFSIALIYNLGGFPYANKESQSFPGDPVMEHEGIEVRTRNIKLLIEDISQLINPVILFLANAPPDAIRELRRRTGQSGLSDSTNALLLEIHKIHPDFNPSGLNEYIQKIDTTNNKEAYSVVIETCEPLIQNHVIITLKNKFGPSRNQWWHEGVKENIRKDATILANSKGEYDFPEKYLYLIDLRNIIFDNWDLFENVYTIDAKQNDSKKKKLAWFDKLNEIRNKVAHPQKGGVKA